MSVAGDVSHRSAMQFILQNTEGMTCGVHQHAVPSGLRLILAFPLPGDSRHRLLTCRAFGTKWLVALTFFFILQPSSFITSARAQSVGISIAVPDNSALLELQSTTQGLLPPRLTNTEMLAVASPATGDLVYNSTYVNYYYFNGTIWTPIVGSGWSILGDLGTHPDTNFLGTIDQEDLVQKTSSREHLRFFATGNVGLTNKVNSAEALEFYEPSGSGTLFTGFKAGLQDSTIHYTLPPADGSPNAGLYDSLGTLGWHVFASFSGSFGDTLWVRGSGTVSLESLGVNNRTSGKYTIASTENCSVSGGDAANAFGDSNAVSSKSGSIAGGSNNSVSSQAAAVRGGAWNSVSGNNSFVNCGLFNETSGQNATIVAGDSNRISGAEAVIINGANNSCAGQDNLIFGANSNPTGSDQLIFNPPTPPEVRMGIMTSSPTEATDVVGNVQFSQALMPNGSGGASNQYLLSAGAGLPPTWGSATFSANNWTLTGNSGSSPATNFIGTTDAEAFVMRTGDVERARIHASGQVSINTTTNVHQLQSFLSGTTDETAAVYGNASGSATAQALGLWGRASNTTTANTGTLSVLATGNGNTSSGQTNVALQVNDGEFTMGRTTEAPGKGTDVEPATDGTAYSQQGPSGVIQLSMGTDLLSSPPTAGVYQDLGTETINNRYITASSIILAGVIAKINASSDPSPKDAIYRVDVQSRAAGSCVIRIGVIPTSTSTHIFHTNDYIRIGYVVINPGR